MQVSWLSVERRAKVQEVATPGRFMDMETWGGSFIICPQGKNRLGMGHRAEKGVEVLDDEHGVI